MKATLNDQSCLKSIQKLSESYPRVVSRYPKVASKLSQSCSKGGAVQDEGDYERPPTMSTTVSERRTRLLLTIQVHSLFSAVVCPEFQVYFG